MRRSNGILGFTVTIIAVMGTVLMGVAMSTTSTMDTVTGYEYVTDVSGLFTYDQTPQFLEYNPSDNWTGYYSTSTPNNNPTAGINYTPNPVANLYPIHQSGITKLGAFQIPGGSGVNEFSGKVITAEYYTASGTYQGYAAIGREDTTYAVYLTDVVNAIVGTDTTVARIIFGQGTYSDLDPVILKISEYKASGAGSYRYNVTPRTFEVDVDRLICTAKYSDGSIIWQAGVGDVVVLRNGLIRDSTGVATGDYITDVLSYSSYHQDPPTYMDISKGVMVTNPTYWVNGYQNSRIDILFHSPGTGNYYSSGFEVVPTDLDGNADTGNRSVLVYVSRTADGQMSAAVTVTTYNIPTTYSTSIGRWDDVIVTLDLKNGEVIYTPITRFVSFTDYTVSDKTVKSNAVLSLDRIATNIHWRHYSSELQIGVVRTDVFMDTYDSIMTDPSINIVDQFPDLKDSGYRLNFYSFIPIDEGSNLIEINGKDFIVRDGLVYIGGRGHELNNLAVNYTPQNGTNQCSIILLNEDDWTYKLGQTTTYKISFTGHWTFTTGLWEGYQKAVERTAFDFSTFAFDSNMAILMFMAILCIGTALCARYYGMGTYDYIVVFFAGLCGFVLITI